MTENTLDQLAEAVLKLAELQGQLIERLQRMDSALRHVVEDNGVDSCSFEERFDRLCRDVADIERRTRSLEDSQ